MDPIGLHQPPAPEASCTASAAARVASTRAPAAPAPPPVPRPDVGCAAGRLRATDLPAELRQQVAALAEDRSSSPSSLTQLCSVTLSRARGASPASDPPGSSPVDSPRSGTTAARTGSPHTVRTVRGRQSRTLARRPQPGQSSRTRPPGSVPDSGAPPLDHRLQQPALRRPHALQNFPFQRRQRCVTLLSRHLDTGARLVPATVLAWPREGSRCHWGPSSRRRRQPRSAAFVMALTYPFPLERKLAHPLPTGTLTCLRLTVYALADRGLEEGLR